MAGLKQAQESAEAWLGYESGRINAELEVARAPSVRVPARGLVTVRIACSGSPGT